MKVLHPILKIVLCLPLCILMSCSVGDLGPSVEELPGETIQAKFSYLALGDSYTVGESVSSNQSFPVQLVLELNTAQEDRTRVDILAATGWRTDNLLDAINAQPLNTDYDIVTLLIGVNNQFQNREFSQYESEFATLLERAIALAKGESERVFVISIPDYAFTPFSANSDREAISAEIDSYNNYALETATGAGVRFINITDITRKGLDEPDLIASDGLHPSGEAYRQFVERIFPVVLPRLTE